MAAQQSFELRSIHVGQTSRLADVAIGAREQSTTGIGVRFQGLSQTAQRIIADFIDAWTNESLAQLDALGS